MAELGAGARAATDRAPPLDERLATFLASDDEEAKAVVAGLIAEIGFAPVDSGTLREGGRRQEPGTPLYNRDLTGRDAARLLAASAAHAG